MSVRPGLERGTFLDVGCGVGHYGVLLKRHYPLLFYVGTDASAAMIEEALDLHRHEDLRGAFDVRAFAENRFDAFDIVLVSQVMEFTPDPMASLEWALEQMRAGSILILHRLRWGNAAKRVYEKTYCDRDTQNFIWDGALVTRAVLAHGDILRFEKWETSATLVIEKQG